MKNIINSSKPFEINDETYNNQFVNPVIKKALENLAERVEEISVIRTGLACFDSGRNPIGTLTIIWGIQYAEPYVMAYETEYESNETADPGINATAYISVTDVYDAVDDNQLKEIGATEFKTAMEAYWNEVGATWGVQA